MKMRLWEVRLFAVIVCWLALNVCAHATVAEQPSPSIERVLNADGTLNLELGFNGILNPSGYQMLTDASGQPRFVPVTTAQLAAVNADDERWDSRFFSRGVDGSVDAIAVSGTNLYVGGAFKTAGSLIVNGIASWNGSTWSALGSGVEGCCPARVEAIAVSGSDVYVGGVFTNAGGVSCQNIARWNGANWSSLGSGVNGTVNAIVIQGNEVYVGGNFTNAGSIAVNSIAKWNGTEWFGLDSGLTNSLTSNGSFVYALALYAGELWVGGYFTRAGNVEVDNLAKWDGNSWSKAGGGADHFVYALHSDGTNMYAGGLFTRIGNLVSAGKIAKWNGNTWSALGSGVSGGFLPVIRSIVAASNEVFVTGDFTTAGSVSASGVARWDGVQWSRLGNDLRRGHYVGTATCVNFWDGKVFFGGSFSSVGSFVASGIAAWDGVTWSPLETEGEGVSWYSCSAIAVESNAVWVAGDFTTAGSAQAVDIARWNDTGWIAAGSGIGNSNSTAYVNAIIISGTNVFVGGKFANVGTVSANNIARWDGLKWWPLGSGVNGEVFTIAAQGSVIYAGGDFTSAGGFAANRVAKWNGSNWSALGSGVGGNVVGVPLAECIVVSGTNVYVGGYFNAAGGVGANNVAHWDGVNWHSLGGGLDAGCKALAFFGGNLYAGGAFTSKVAKWDGVAWSPLDGGVSGAMATVNALSFHGSSLYVGGRFSSAGGKAANNVARWSAGEWFSLGSGIEPNSYVYALGISGTNVYVGGKFAIAGGKPSSRFARWMEPPCSYSIAPTNSFFPAGATNSTVTLQTSGECGWTATADSGWISVTSSSDGFGSAVVSYSVGVNAGSAPRLGNLMIAGKTVSIVQAGNLAPEVSVTPVTPVTLPVATLNLTAIVTDDSAPFGTVSTVWSKVSGPGAVIFGNANAIDTSATVSTNGTYVLRLTASDGALSASNDVVVTVNARPTITSPLIVTNQFATVGGNPVVQPGDPVGFSIGATDPDGNPLPCLWDFGDGQTSVDCQPSHIFSNCGPHEVTAVVSDGVSPVTNSLIVSVACPLAELPKPTSLKMKSNFAPGKLDTATLKTSVDMPPGFSAPNTLVTLELAGVEIPFTLDAKGQAVNASSSIKFSHKGTGTLWQVSAKLKGDYDTAWQTAGLTNATVTALTIAVPVLLLFDTPVPESFYMEKPLLYKATAGKSGSAK